MDDPILRTIAADAAMIAILRLLVERCGGDFAYRTEDKFFSTDRYRLDSMEKYAWEWIEFASRDAPLTPDEAEREKWIRSLLDQHWIVVKEIGLEALEEEARFRLEQAGGGEG